MIVVGVDSHVRTLAACAVDEVGREVGAIEVANDALGHQRLAGWAAALAASRRFAIEGAQGVGRPLASVLLDHGEQVCEVPATLTRRERATRPAHGKSDRRDARLIAQVALRETTLPALRLSEAARELKLLCDYRRGLAAERTRQANRLHADLVVLVPGARQRLPQLSRARDLEQAELLLLGCVGVHADLARRRLARLRALDAELAADARAITAQVKASGSTLTSLVGVSFLLAAQILGETGDVRRFADRDRYASMTGTAPIPASSGQTTRHRLNRYGNRRLNHALYYMALTQSRCDPRARAYLARRRDQDGKTSKEAIRALMRRLSDVVYRQMQADQRALDTHPPR